MYMTEDEVRDQAKLLLELDQPEKDVLQGTGQLTTFKQLGFKGNGANHKPDGWYLPKDLSKIAIILETKSSEKKLIIKHI